MKQMQQDVEKQFGVWLTSHRCNRIIVVVYAAQWRNRLTGGPWTNYIKGPIPHFEFTEQFIIIKVLTKLPLNAKQ